MKKILFALLATVTCVAMIGGAFAYFTDYAVSETNQFTAGTLDIEVEDDADDVFVLDLGSVGNMAPGDITPWIEIKVENAGSLPAATYARFFFPSDIDLGPALKIYDWQVLYYNGNGNPNHRWATHDPYFGTATNEDYFVKDGVAGFNMGANFLAVDPGDNRGAYDGEALPAGAFYLLKVRLQMDPAAGDEYQGKSCDVAFEVKATQNVAAAIATQNIPVIGTDVVVAQYDVDYFTTQLTSQYP